jgi:UDP-N-acetylmuramoyl-tripeptide--D-alanyl-D-alanine ligase
MNISDKVSWPELIQAVSGERLQGDLDQPITEVSTDTRSLKKGALFVALRGDRFNGHDYLEKVYEKGASGAIVSEPLKPGRIPTNFPVIQVQDSLWALGDLAGLWRSKFPVILTAVSGSNGKTTTKDMLAAILNLEGATLKNQGNFNNWIGLPLSLFSLNESHRFAVMEMGMNHRGEIERLCRIARPSVGLLTNIGPAHLEGLGSMEAIAQAKGELFQSLGEKDWAIINQDDFRIREQASTCRARKLTFGRDPGADVRGEDLGLSSEGSRFRLLFEGTQEELFVPLQGEHNVSNALGAAAAALALGLSGEKIKQGLAGFTPPAHRLQIKKGIRGVRLIDDAYNANPASLKAALLTFQSLRQGERGGLVLGDMLELGSESLKAHQEIGRQVGEMGVEYLLALGPLSRALLAEAQNGPKPPGKAFGVLDQGSLLDHLHAVMEPGDLILIKGSHGMDLESVVNALEDQG